ncbi:MAG: hypothetical protein ACR2QW_18640 [bacterium]
MPPQTVGVETGIGIPKPLEARAGKIRTYRDVLVASYGISSAISTKHRQQISQNRN